MRLILAWQSAVLLHLGFRARALELGVLISDYMQSFVLRTRWVEGFKTFGLGFRVACGVSHSQ